MNVMMRNMNQRTLDSFIPTANIANLGKQSWHCPSVFVSKTERSIDRVECNEPGNSDYFDDEKSDLGVK